MAKLTRRNAIVGLAVLVVASGVLAASGAFTTVQADRTVNVQTAGDASALLAMDVIGDLEGSTDDTIAFDLNNDLNLNATTTFDGAFTITNNGQNSVDVTIQDGSSTDLLVSSAGSAGTGMYFVNGSVGSNTYTLNAGDTATLDVIFNLDGVTTTSAGNSSIPGTITIEANA